MGIPIIIKTLSFHCIFLHQGSSITLLFVPSLLQKHVSTISLQRQPHQQPCLQNLPVDLHFNYPSHMSNIHSVSRPHDLQYTIHMVADININLVQCQQEYKSACNQTQLDISQPIRVSLIYFCHLQNLSGKNALIQVTTAVFVKCYLAS